MAALLVTLSCGEEAPEGGLAAYFERVGELRVTPVENFRRVPESLTVLPDGRLVLAETEGVWIHVLRRDGQGITRLGGESSEPLGLSGAPAGTFQSLSSVVGSRDDRLLAADRTSSLISVFSPALEPESTFTVPASRSVWQLASLADGRLAAAVAPRHPTADGQIVLFEPGKPERAFLPQDPLFRHNRWGAISSTRLELLAGDRILVHWPPLPWAKLLTGAGDSLPPVGKPSPLYRVPASGPPEGAALPVLRAWYGSFSPLVNVEAVGPVLVFQFLAAGTDAQGQLPGFTDGDGARPERAPPPVGERKTFVNLYREDGRTIATDVMLPPGSRVMESNDRERLYLLTRASPRELAIEIWRPNPDPLKERRS